MKRGIVPGRLRAYPLFFASLALLVLAAGAGAADLVREARRVRAAEAECARLRFEWATPQARPEMVAATKEELVRANDALRQARARWLGIGSAAAPDRLGAFAELSAFVERSRVDAARAGVAVAKDERFGLARHANEAPDADEVAAVLAQRQAIDRVLAVLFAAGPEKLLGVWRENPKTEAAAREGDWCTLPVARSLRTPGVVRTRVVQVGFAGTTACLRAFLNGLDAEASLVVREVTVAPEETKGARDKNVPASLGPRALHFTVLLEAVELEGGTRADTWTAAGAESAPAAWAEAQAQPGVTAGGRGFELFAPPPLTFSIEEKRWVPAKGTPKAADAGLGIELLAVRHSPYRWRLVGHTGEGAEGRALLEEATSRRMLRLRIGERDAACGVELKALERVRGRDGGVVERATLIDPGEREPVLLTTAGDGMRAPLVAVLRVRGEAKPVEIRSGATIRVGGADYCAGAIVAEPAAVELTRAGPRGKRGETMRLVVAAAAQ